MTEHVMLFCVVGIAAVLFALYYLNGVFFLILQGLSMSVVYLKLYFEFVDAK